MEQCGNEMKMLVVEDDADLLYKEYKGTVISKNILNIGSAKLECVQRSN